MDLIFVISILLVRCLHIKPTYLHIHASNMLNSAVICFMVDDFKSGSLPARIPDISYDLCVLRV